MILLPVEILYLASAVSIAAATVKTPRQFFVHSLARALKAAQLPGEGSLRGGGMIRFDSQRCVSPQRDCQTLKVLALPQFPTTSQASLCQQHSSKSLRVA
jgi:hypothetical protein